MGDASLKELCKTEVMNSANKYLNQYKNIFTYLNLNLKHFELPISK